MSPAQLNNKGIFNWNALMGTHLNEQAKFEKEPERGSLTQPPAGYQTPSSAYPYGTGRNRAAAGRFRTSWTARLVPTDNPCAPCCAITGHLCSAPGP